MKKIEAIIRPERLEQAKVALTEHGYAGLHVESVTGRGQQRGVIHSGRRGETYAIDMLPKVKLTVVVRDDQLDEATNLVIAASRTGNIGDGMIFVSPVEDAIRVRTSERGDGILRRAPDPKPPQPTPSAPAPATGRDTAPPAPGDRR